MVERVKRTLTQVASIICKGDGSQWSKLVGEIEYAMNTKGEWRNRILPMCGRLPPLPAYTDVMGQGETEGGGGRMREIQDSMNAELKPSNTSHMKTKWQQQEHNNRTMTPTLELTNSP